MYNYAYYSYAIGYCILTVINSISDNLVDASVVFLMQIAALYELSKIFFRLSTNLYVSLGPLDFKKRILILKLELISLIFYIILSIYNPLMSPLLFIVSVKYLSTYPVYMGGKK